MNVKTGVERDLTRADILRTSVDLKISGSEGLQQGRHMSLQPIHVKLCVYDILGREIEILVNEIQSPGIYDVQFNAAGLSSGIYFYRLDAGVFSDVKKMILLR